MEKLRPTTIRRRARDLGVTIGRFRPGKYNAITDVAGVRVGHSTLNYGDAKSNARKGIVRTGVTAILPNEGNVFSDRIVGGGFVLNGAGEISGFTQVMEWGLIETPILLTNTFSVGTCSNAIVKYMLRQYPSIGLKHDVIIPLVGECDDSWLNDIAGRHVEAKHVYQAIENAHGGPVEEGNVGGGTGMITCDFKGGIGTSSRKLPQVQGGYMLGVLVMTNFGEMRNLRIDGFPIGRFLEPDYAHLRKRIDNYGSIIAVIATDAPLLPHQLNRLAKRVSLGVGKVGSFAAHGSGELMLAFSTANAVPRESNKMVYKMKILLDKCINPLYEAAIEATEEAIINALFMGQDMMGVNGNYCPALPIDKVVQLLKQQRKLFGSNTPFSPSPL